MPPTASATHLTAKLHCGVQGDDHVEKHIILTLYFVVYYSAHAQMCAHINSHPEEFTYS